MTGLVILAVSVVFVGWILWMRRRRTRAYTTAVPPGGISSQTLALDTFARGNSYLAEGRFDDAIAAFHQARELDPKRAHVADRLAEAQQRQHAARATQPAQGTP